MAAITMYKRGEVFYVYDKSGSKRHMVILTCKSPMTDSFVYGFTITSNQYGTIEKPVPIEVNDKTSWIDPSIMRRIYIKQLEPGNYAGAIDDFEILDLISDMYDMYTGRKLHISIDDVMDRYTKYFAKYFSTHDTFNKEGEGSKLSNYTTVPANVTYDDTEEDDAQPASFTQKATTAHAKKTVVKTQQEVTTVELFGQKLDINMSGNELYNLSAKYNGASVLKWSNEDMREFLTLSEDVHDACNVLNIQKNTLQQYKYLIRKKLGLVGMSH